MKVCFISSIKVVVWSSVNSFNDTSPMDISVVTYGTSGSGSVTGSGSGSGGEVVVFTLTSPKETSFMLVSVTVSIISITDPRLPLPSR